MAIFQNGNIINVLLKKETAAMPSSPLSSPLAPFRQIELKGRERVFIADIGRPSPLSV